ncbi:MAG: hypothetical protein ABJL99_12330 [Aliishimia sp.]
MNQTIPPNALAQAKEADSTQPPLGALRFEMPQDLYAAIPQLSELTQKRPMADEDALDYLWRLRASTTPEEAVTYTAFAALPQMAIWWAHECLRLMPETLDQADLDMMENVGRWISAPNKDMRHQIMRQALWASKRSPAVMLGLSVGWSGGSIAPNDPANVPVSRSPKSINSAVLSSLAQAQLSRRSVLLAKIIDMAESLFRVY